MENGPIITILAFAMKNGFVKTSSFNSHLSGLGIYGDDRRNTLDALVTCRYLDRMRGSGVVYKWRITRDGVDFLAKAGIVTPEQIKAAAVPPTEGVE